ncbi:hypothetical protein ACSFA0_24500 [Variovorax sp. LT1P1]|uniref:hypothetical protein n=1 Tax=Variovorax sp. LT1P1 TaxID=3443730 RepID=UPI003F4851FE
MTDHLRRISLSVDEPDPGCFYWLLMESTEDAAIWAELQASEQRYDSYSAALRAGLAVLERLGSAKFGPRLTGEDEDTSPVG